MKVFETLADLQLQTLSAEDNPIVMVKGYQFANDGGGALFRIVDTETEFPLANGNYAELLRTNPSADVQDTAFSARDAMFSWWVGPKCVRHKEYPVDRTYQTFTERSGASGIIIRDHANKTTSRYVLNSDLSKDDHNAGCVAVGDGKVVVVIGGRSNTVQPVDECFVAEWDIDGEPFDSSYSTYFLQVGRDYPNIYQCGDEVILIASQRGDTDGSTTGHSYMLNSWPLGSGAGSWSAKTDITDQSVVPDWMYLTTRRDTDDPNVIHMAWGFHPTNEPNGSVYKSEIRYLPEEDNPWRLFSDGVEIANLSTGAGLPVDLTDLEQAYASGGAERTRLFDVRKDSMVIASYVDTGNPSADKASAVYKYVYKSAGTWFVTDIEDTGKPFLESSVYWGGACISDNDGTEIFLSRETGGHWLFEKYTTSDGGDTFNLVEQYDLAKDNDTGTNAVHGRVVAEVPSLSTLNTDLDSNVDLHYQVTGWVGYYDPESFQKYFTSVVTLDRLDAGFALSAPEYQSFSAASKDCDSHGNHTVALASVNADFDSTNDIGLQFAAACENSSMGGTQRQATVADSGSSLITRNTFSGGTRNCTYTGPLDTDDNTTTSHWLMGGLGSDGCTTGKVLSGFLASRDVTFDNGNNINVVANAAVASEDIASDANSSYVTAIASNSCDVDGINVAVIAAGSSDTQLSASENYSAIVASGTSSTSAARTAVLGSLASSADGIGSSVLSSDGCTANAEGASIVASKNVQQDNAWTLSGGYAASGSASTANRTWEIDSQTGEMFLASTLSQNHTFADIAKMIKNGEGSEIEPGYLLSMFGDQVFKAREGEEVDGIVAATPSVIHNDTPVHWQGRYILDEFGRQITEEKLFVRWGSYYGVLTEDTELPPNAETFTKTFFVDKDQSEEVTYVKWSEVFDLRENFDEVPSFAEEVLKEVPVENPEYSPEIQQVPRSERPDEWTITGVHGLIRTRVDSTVTQNSVQAATSNRQNLYLEPSSVPGVGRLASSETNIKIMAVESEYTPEKGYGVALCFLKG